MTLAAMAVGQNAVKSLAQPVARSGALVEKLGAVAMPNRKAIIKVVRQVADLKARWQTSIGHVDD
ncbi:hypothetical protein PspLS_10026 [Pyricularia sp. CBS 133598]|nr:hypothetical protein PspLS_10026 [Pyricularia sp. CBS 133598]